MLRPSAEGTGRGGGRHGGGIPYGHIVHFGIIYWIFIYIRRFMRTSLDSLDSSIFERTPRNLVNPASNHVTRLSRIQKHRAIFDQVLETTLTNKMNPGLRFSSFLLAHPRTAKPPSLYCTGPLSATPPMSTMGSLTTDMLVRSSMSLGQKKNNYS